MQIMIASAAFLGALALVGLVIFYRNSRRSNPTLALIRCHWPSSMNLNQQEILGMAVSLARINNDRSDPLGNALEKVAAANNISIPEIKFPEKMPNGLGAIIGERASVMGNHELMTSLGLEWPQEILARIKIEEAQGRRVIYLGWQGEVRAMLVFEPSIGL